MIQAPCKLIFWLPNAQILRLTFYWISVRNQDVLDVPVRATVLSAVSMCLTFISWPISSGLIKDLYTRAEVLHYFGQLYTLHCPLTVAVSFVSQQSREVELQAATGRHARQIIERQYALKMKKQRDDKKLQNHQNEMSKNTHTSSC